MLTREQSVNFLLDNPVKFANMLGFEKLIDLHNSWIIGMVRGEDDHTLMAHRGSFKTTCVSFALALIIILLPKEKIMFMRKTDVDVKEVIKQVQKILSDPKTVYLIKCIYGINFEMCVRSSTEITTNLAIDNRGTSQLIGIGTGGSLTGKHFDKIFTDDIINLQDRISRAERDRTKLIYQELQNIKNQGGRIYNTLTPWHKDDASVLMPKAEVYDCYQTGLIDRSKLSEIRQSMTPSLFAANYELKHIANEESLFDNPIFTKDNDLILNGIAHIDASYGGSDGTAFTVLKQHGEQLVIYGMRWNKHVNDCLNIIFNYLKMYKVGTVYVETNADKGYLAKELRGRGAIVGEYHESTNKFVKISTYLRKNWKDITFLECTDPEYMNEILDYTENAEHDDSPDGLASLIRISTKPKWLY